MAITEQTIPLLSLGPWPIEDSDFAPVPPWTLSNMKAKPCGLAELRSCVKVEVAVLSSPSLIVLVVSVDVNHR